MKSPRALPLPARAPGPASCTDGASRKTAAPLTLLLPIAPSTNNLFVNAKRGGRRKSDGYLIWQEEANCAGAKQITHRFSGEVIVSIALPLGDKADVDNRCKASLDWLVNRQIIQDDSVIRQLLVKRSLAGKHEKDWMVVTVEAA